MGFWGFGGGKKPKHLVVVTYEGGGRLRLNGNRSLGPKYKQNASNHSGTVCWIEFDTGGIPLDQGLGPSAGQLGSGVAERLLRELPQTTECRGIRADLERSPADASRWLAWGNSSGARGGVDSRGKS